MHFRRNFFYYTGFFAFVLVLFFPAGFLPADTVYADRPYIIVLDPGHGGENLGGEYGGYTEKDLNMVVALAMYEELQKYENVEIYLTHTEDVDMSLRERAEYAAEKNADFLFCLHFNMSPNHNLFGSEVWISAFDEYYAKGLSFGKIQIETMEAMGLYSRGVKTKLKEDGTADYYGIIRESRDLGLTCALIEHCHLDHKNDKGHYETTASLQAMGRADAESVAKYFGLRSEVLGVDYSDYPREEVPVPNYIMAPDSTDPDVCYFEEVSCDLSTGTLTFDLTAQDYDSPMLYYNYSTDGGLTWSELFPWETGKDTQTVSLTIPSGQEMPAVIFRAYNLFDRFTESNTITYPTFRYGEALPEPSEEDLPFEDMEEVVEADSDQVRTTFAKDKSEEEEEKEFSFLLFLEICLGLAVLIFFSAVMARLFSGSGKKSGKKRHRRN